MAEKFPKSPELPQALAESAFRKLVTELIDRPETFPFCGLDEQAYAELRANDEEVPGFVTPIDELIKRFETHGMKVVFGDDPFSGNVHLLPGDSDNIVEDSIFPRHLNPDMADSRLKILILHNKSRNEQLEEARSKKPTPDKTKN